MTKKSGRIDVKFMFRTYIGLSLFVLTILPITAVILAYETETALPKENALFLIPVFMLLAIRSISGFLEHILIRHNLIKIQEFAERIMDGEYDAHFSLPLQKDEENRYVQVFRSLEALARYVRGQNRMLLSSLKQTRSEAELMKQLAVKDALTGLFNRRYFDAAIDEEAEKAFRGSYPLTLILIDCDKFKRINDSYGHDAGDRILKLLAEKMAGAVRNGKDIPFRFGGDEFGIIMPEADINAAKKAVNRLTDAYMASDRLGTTLSISAVSAEFKDREKLNRDIKALIKQVDEGIYAVKKHGGAGARFKIYGETNLSIQAV